MSSCIFTLHLPRSENSGVLGKEKMADTSHLERMGRELKCPICLSLLNSAVSLSCNHVFCNSCIEKSMKTTSNCPVCKVPFRRREIRSAPHMDNLVSVYKSMEVASGVNIFVTQNADSNKASVGVNNCEAENAVQAGNTRSPQKGLEGALKSNKRQTGSNNMKPSFPTKKRVQVPQCPNSETQMDPEKLEPGIGKLDRKKPEKCPASLKNMSCTVENREPVFSPFFWLRDEEDLENPSQQTDDNQVLYTPPDAPCFSDIKDSDDEDSSKRSSEKGAGIISTGAEFIDSEMFDWTQRPCSPELCSTPPAIQTDYTVEEVQKNAETMMMETTTGPKQGPKNRESLGKKRTNGTLKAKSERRASKKIVKNATESRKSKRAKKITDEVPVVPSEFVMVTHQGIKEISESNPLILRGNPKNNGNACSKGNFHEKCVPKLPQGTQPPANCNETASLHVFPSGNLQRSNEGSINTTRSHKSSTNTKKALVRPKKIGRIAAKLDTSKVHINTEQHNEVICTSNSNNDLTDRLKRTCEENNKKILTSFKKVKFSLEDKCESTPLTAKVDGIVKGQTGEIQGATDLKRVKILEKMDKEANSFDGSDLVKCNTSSAIRCAFCQSSEESEVSGIMVYYANGKSVEENRNAKTNGIHVHKNCAEWAPNVYFEDDNVINLETELSRSRRITCSCCGTKGAALGCYEKSCRKSFHVPCAKLTPECRWDSENFVMLCPIHASCQLPSEMPQSQYKQKRNYAVKRKPAAQVHQGKSVYNSEQEDSSLQWKSHKKLKRLILCCSALTTAERRIVSEFEKLSGATILKNWAPSVTHVIASTDENGACRRTLKYLMGVLEGKWILTVQWIKACMAAGELIDEQDFEISVDIHGIRDGPKIGRLRYLNKQRKLFEGCTMYFMGDFEPSYKGYLHNLVIAGGGKVLNRRPVAEDQANALNRCPGATTFVIFSLDLELPEQCSPSILNQRRAKAEALATSAGAVVATNSWILNTISGSRWQEMEYH